MKMLEGEIASSKAIAKKHPPPNKSNAAHKTNQVFSELITIDQKSTTDYK